MANLVETPGWEAGIYQIETTDPVEGGPGGVTNTPPRQLANRTAYLKQLVETIDTGKQPIDALLTALAALVTSADKLAYFTGADAVAQTTLTAYMRTALAAVDAAAARTVLGAASPADIATAITALVDASPGALDTLNELAAALGDDSNFAATINAALAARAQLAAAQSFTKAQRGAVVALADGATIIPDFSLANNFSVTLGGNRTLAAPTNLVAGQSGIITITQDATGSRTLAFAAAWKFAGGVAPSLTTAANAVDELAYYVKPGGATVFASLAKDVK